MSAPDLFDAETAILAAARSVAGQDDLPAADYQLALCKLVGHYERLMRETRRLICRSDREERMLTDMNQRLHQLAVELEYTARHDNLTGCLNRGAILGLARTLLERGSLAFIVLDVDLFKQINDTHGHPTGDAVIREVVARLAQTLAGAGELGRIGGEEFALLLPGAPLAEALSMAERLRLAIDQPPFPALPAGRVTASFGVSWTPAGGTLEEAYKRADEALYEAKRRGRNRVEYAAPATPPSPQPAEIPTAKASAELST